MLTPSEPMYRPLFDGLVLKSIADENDVERISAFNGMIHGEGVTSMSRELILNHPATRPEHWLFVEDENAKKVVSALCLIPWMWNFEGVTLKAGEMGIVGTDEAYRRRGLIRALDVRFKELLKEGQFHLSQIQGIPYYYRQFGYEYALPLEGGHRVELYNIPDAPPPDGITFRKATLDDIRVLHHLYRETIPLSLDLYTLRDAAIWKFLLGPSMKTDMVADTWIIERGDTALGYWRISHHGFGEGLIISEASAIPGQLAAAVLTKCKQLAQEAGKPYIRLNMQRKHALVDLARAWGAKDLGTYAWQIHIPDVKRLLDALIPIFEMRLAKSTFSGMTRRFVISFYRDVYELLFENGCITTINRLKNSDEWGDLRMPPNVFAPLVFGYRSREALAENYPDFGCHGEGQVLTDILFPQLNAYFYTQY